MYYLPSTVPTHEEVARMRDEIATFERRQRDVLAIHEPSGDMPRHCLEDGEAWPCETLRALGVVDLDDVEPVDEPVLRQFVIQPHYCHSACYREQCVTHRVYSDSPEWPTASVGAVPFSDEPVPYVLVQDAEERRRLSTTASDGQTCMIYRGGVA